MTNSNGPYRDAAISDANKTVFDAWGNEAGVDYWLAPAGTAACGKLAE